MEEDPPLDTLSESIGLLFLAVQIFHKTLLTSYLLSKPVSFDGDVLGSWSHYMQLMVLSDLNQSIIIIEDCIMSNKLWSLRILSYRSYRITK